MSMAPLHSIYQEDQNEVQHDFLGHVIPLASAAHDADGVVSSTTAFPRSRQLK